MSSLSELAKKSSCVVFPPGTGFATCSIKESAADSDADLDVDGDDTLEYGKAQYTEADIIPCSGAGEDQGEAREREALRGAVLK